MRSGMNSRSNATEPACTVPGAVGVVSTASKSPDHLLLPDGRRHARQHQAGGEADQ